MGVEIMTDRNTELIELSEKVHHLETKIKAMDARIKTLDEQLRQIRTVMRGGQI